MGLSEGRWRNDVTSHIRHISSHSRFDVTLPGFEKVFFSTSKNVTIFLELGTNVTISSHRHIIFLGSAWNKTYFQNLPRSWVLGSRFSNSGLERPSRSLETRHDKTKQHTQTAWENMGPPNGKSTPHVNISLTQSKQRKRPWRGGVLWLTKGIQGYHGNNKLDQSHTCLIQRNALRRMLWGGYN